MLTRAGYQVGQLWLQLAQLSLHLCLCLCRCQPYDCRVVPRSGFQLLAKCIVGSSQQAYEQKPAKGVSKECFHNTELVLEKVMPESGGAQKRSAFPDRRMLKWKSVCG